MFFDFLCLQLVQGLHFGGLGFGGSTTGCMNTTDIDKPQRKHRKHCPDSPTFRGHPPKLQFSPSRDSNSKRVWHTLLLHIDQPVLEGDSDGWHDFAFVMFCVGPARFNLA